MWLEGINIALTAFLIHRTLKLEHRIKTFEKESKNVQKFIRFLGQELKLPEEKIIHEIRKPKKTGTPRVHKKTEEDEFQKELPPSLTGQKAV